MLPKHVALSHASRYQAPGMEEGFESIKTLDFKVQMMSEMFCHVYTYTDSSS